MNLWRLLIHILSLLIIRRLIVIRSVSAVCDYSDTEGNKLYNYSLAASSEKYPHGVLSEDGYYKLLSNGTVVWFQLCDAMVSTTTNPDVLIAGKRDVKPFLHIPIPGHDPKGMIFKERGGSSRCGMVCSALMSNNILGYPVCTTIGRTATITTDLIDKKSPHMGLIVNMWHKGPEVNCSLAVSVVCDSKQVQGPEMLEKVGLCSYATQLRHPSGCANVAYTKSSGLGWFSTLLIIILCLFGGYLIAGAAYRFFYLGMRGIGIISKLEFWASLPHRGQSAFMSLVRRGYRGSHSPVKF